MNAMKIFEILAVLLLIPLLVLALPFLLLWLFLEIDYWQFHQKKNSKPSEFEGWMV